MTLPSTLSPSSAKAASAGALALSHSSMLPGQLGNIDAYIQAVNRIPMLTPTEERQFATEFREQANLESARRLVLSHLRLVVSIARNYLGYGLPLADLVQEGNIGLMKAVKRFDPSVGVRLVSFAVHWIRAEIHEYVLPNGRLVKVPPTRPQRKLFFNLRRLKKNLSWLSREETRAVARDLGVTPGEVSEMEKRLAARDMSFDPTPESDDEEVYSPASYLPAADADPAESVENAEWESDSSDRLANALSRLDDRSRDILQKRWMADDKATLHELADKYGVSAERIRQIEANALSKLRGYMGETVAA